MLVAAGPAAAAAISGLAFVNNSSPDALIDEPQRVREFSTRSQFGATSSNADQARFEHRMAWFAGQRVEQGLAGGPQAWGNEIAYDLVFTVEDPTLRGYLLDIDAVLRGYVTAYARGSGTDFAPLVFATGTPMLAFLDAGSGFSPVLSLTTPLGVASANQDDELENDLVLDVASYTSDAFFGTRSFTLRYAAAAANALAAMGTLSYGEAGVRFGNEPTSNRFARIGYPGTDGESAADHGHFVAVTARYRSDPAQVSEPGTLALLGLALLGLGSTTRRRSGRVD